MEPARLTDTLLIDTDVAYELADVNDRILLRLKGPCRKWSFTSCWAGAWGEAGGGAAR
jgi:hypothetical protein